MSLLRTQRFMPLFQTQFLGAFNDNMLKNALVMLLTYRIATVSAANVQMLVTIAGSLLMIPPLLFSATSGELADKFDKARLTRIIKLVEIGIMLAATGGFLTHNVPVLFAALLGMGVHSTFFGPIKLALLPQHLRPDELLAGNAYIEAGTFLAILLGTMAGGVLILLPAGGIVISLAVLGVAVTGYLASRHIPPAPAADPGLKLNWNIIRESWRIVDHVRAGRDMFLCILGISWFWLVGATILSQVAPYVKLYLHAQPGVVTLLLSVFSIGAAAGSLLSNKLLRGHIQVTYVPVAALAITVFAADLFFASLPAAATATLLPLGVFLRSFTCWRVVFDVLMLAVAGGLYIVPLYALLQKLADPAQCARVIAASNIMNAVFMVGSAVATILLLWLGLTVPQIYLAVAFANLGVAVYICQLLPDALLRSLLRTGLSFLFRVEVKGMEHYAQAGNRVLIIANHTSFLDAVLIAAFMPEKLHFAVNTHIATRWWIRPALKLVDAFPLDPTKPLAAKSLIDLLRRDEKCMIFPEGRLTVTGALMKIYEGPALIADKSGAQLLPVRIDGAQYTPFSRLKGKVRIRLFPKITLTVLPPRRFVLPEGASGRERRRLASAQLYDVMSEMVFASTDTQKTLFASLVAASHVHGRAHLIAEDAERKPLSYGQVLVRAFALGRMLNRHVREEASVGLMLPNSTATLVSFFALQAFGKTPAMINFTAGSAQIRQACGVARLATIITSRRFIQTAKFEAKAAELSAAGITIAYLEDLAASVNLFDKLFGLLAARIPLRACAKPSPEAPAVILYTSGSEGAPKGVALSHRNILANCSQLASRIDFGPQDKVFNVLPVFHAFGLTGGALLPLFSGVRTFYYPSPLHYRIVPELIYDTDSTILFGTDTFLSAYARVAHPYDLNSIRYVFAGAERLREETRRVYADKFGVRVFEGYGATEMSPVISMNTPMQNRIGTVGRLLPGLDYRLDAVPGIEDGAVLHVKGPNVMLGYLKEDAPGVIQPAADGWYDTGDIVALDADGYVTIKGRLKRFAKIGGEMVSLGAAEAAVARLWPAEKHAVVSVAEAGKGEQIVLLTGHEGAARDEILRHFRAEGLSDLAIPKKIIYAPALPLLGTGKTNYEQVKAMAAGTVMHG
jgi:acyl-[acyl-carrier-protein]-phospholipid O-acyltransferase/long-chain-fatty-acid--[acyl-carrier-protein] ligase